jgi:hypothetical protein
MNAVGPEAVPAVALDVAEGEPRTDSDSDKQPNQCADKETVARATGRRRFEGRPSLRTPQPALESRIIARTVP